MTVGGWGGGVAAVQPEGGGSGQGLGGLWTKLGVVPQHPWTPSRALSLRVLFPWPSLSPKPSAQHRGILSCCLPPMKTHTSWFGGWQSPGSKAELVPLHPPFWWLQPRLWPREASAFPPLPYLRRAFHTQTFRELCTVVPLNLPLTLCRTRQGSLQPRLTGAVPCGVGGTSDWPQISARGRAVPASCPGSGLDQPHRLRGLSGTVPPTAPLGLQNQARLAFRVLGSQLWPVTGAP